MTAQETAAPPEASGHMTIWEHIAELRSRLLKIIITVLIGAVVGWFLFPYVIAFLKHPFNEVQPGAPFISTEPLQAFALRIKMSAYIGVAFAMPVILWQLWRFITPALYTHERRYAVPFTSSALILFVAGASLAYFILNPTLDFLVHIGGPDIQPFYTADSYVTLIVWMMLAFGIGFEFPVVVVALQLLGVVTPRRLLGWWRMAIVIVAVIAAVITPSGDPISMFALALPMTLLYFASIGIGAAVLKLRRRKASRVARDSADTSD
jgi:sec-independent protein translocase protein TatC